MPRLVIKRTPRRLQASLASFEREYPRAIIESVLRPWGKDVVRTAMRTRTFQEPDGSVCGVGCVAPSTVRD